MTMIRICMKQRSKKPYVKLPQNNTHFENYSGESEIYIYIYIYIYATPPLRSMDFRLLGRGRLRVFSHYLIQKSCQHETSLNLLLV